jgi:glycosyltransferase involved in cell wall biosynthesis
MAVDFLIIATGYNCQDNVKRCFDSVMSQDYEHFTAVFIDDGSTDNTGRELMEAKYAHNKVYRFIYQDNQGAAYRRWQALKYPAFFDDEQVVVLLGLDDELLAGALTRIAKEYESGAWVTYGNWKYPHGGGLPKDFPLEFPDEVHADRSYRQHRYRSTAPNTFKKFLFDQLDESEFKYNDQWIKATTESNLMISCLEMSGKEHIAVIKEPIYLYRYDSSKSARNRLGSTYQDAVYANVVKKIKKELLVR